MGSGFGCVRFPYVKKRGSSLRCWWCRRNREGVVWVFVLFTGGRVAVGVGWEQFYGSDAGGVGLRFLFRGLGVCGLLGTGGG